VLQETRSVLRECRCKWFNVDQPLASVLSVLRETRSVLRETCSVLLDTLEAAQERRSVFRETLDGRTKPPRLWPAEPV
jgi:hypothetical protein